MNISFEAKDIILVLVGVAGSVVASYIYKALEGTNSAAKALEQQLTSTDATERSKASRKALFISAKFYIFANIFWVVSGAAWMFGGGDQGVTMLVLGLTSIVAVLLFWVALRWLMRAKRAGDA